MNLIPDLMDNPFIKNTQSVYILVESEFNTDVDLLLQKYSFVVHDEIIMIYKKLNNELVQGETHYEVKDLNKISIKEFKNIWKEAMEGSLNAPSSLTLDDHMRSVELELGPNYKDSCIIAFDKERPIGVIMPHIESGTIKEGRVFYFGLIPEERGKGKSRRLHQQALNILKSKFHASYYIGCTSHNNKLMLKTYMNNM